MYSPIGQNAYVPWNGSDGLWTIDSKYMSAMKQGIRWTVAKGQYDVKVTRLSQDDEDDHYYDTIWTCLRSLAYGIPVTLPGADPDRRPHPSQQAVERHVGPVQRDGDLQAQRVERQYLAP